MSPTDFYSLTIREANLVLEGFEENNKDNYYLNLYANINALGNCFGGKKFKMIDPFKEQNKKASLDDRKNTFKHLNKVFGGGLVV